MNFYGHTSCDARAWAQKWWSRGVLGWFWVVKSTRSVDCVPQGPDQRRGRCGRTWRNTRRPHGAALRLGGRGGAGAASACGLTAQNGLFDPKEYEWAPGNAAWAVLSLRNGHGGPGEETWGAPYGGRACGRRAARACPYGTHGVGGQTLK